MSRFVDATPLLHLINTTRQRLKSVYDKNRQGKEWKFIVLLREPVARDFSWYQHKIRDELSKGSKFTSIKTFQEIQREECSSRYMKSCSRHRRGNYVEQLTLFTEVFRRDQLLVLNSNMMFRDPQRVLETIRRFLEVPRVKAWRQSFPHDDHLNAMRFKGMVECLRKHTPRLDCGLRDTLADYYDPLNVELYRWLNRTRHDNPIEPFFRPFGDDFKNISCVADARIAFDAVMKSSAAGSRFNCEV
jgi:hypothetical protein